MPLHLFFMIFGCLGINGIEVVLMVIHGHDILSLLLDYSVITIILAIVFTFSDIVIQIVQGGVPLPSASPGNKRRGRGDEHDTTYKPILFPFLPFCCCCVCVFLFFSSFLERKKDNMVFASPLES